MEQAGIIYFRHVSFRLYSVGQYRGAGSKMAASEVPYQSGVVWVPGISDNKNRHPGSDRRNVFRASTLQAGFAMLRQMVTNFRFATLNGDLLKQMGVDWKDMGIVLVTILIIFAISVWNERV